MNAIEILSRSFRELDIDIPTRVSRSRPPLCGVYMLVGSVGILYVGQSIDIHRRVSGHRSEFNRLGYQEFNRALWYPIPEGCLDYYEGAFIRALRPQYNRSAPPRTDGYDQEILEGFGLPVYGDEDVNSAAWSKVRQDRRMAREVGRVWTVELDDSGPDDSDSIQ